MSRPKSLHELVNTSYPNLSDLRGLLNKGCDVNALDREGRTPLYIAAYMNETTDAMGLLLEQGANLDNGGTDVEPPLFRATDDRHNMATKLRFLLDHGADPNIKYGSFSILGYICKIPDNLSHVKSELITLLLEQGAHAFVEDGGPGFIQPLQAVAATTTEEGWPRYCLDLIIDAIPTRYRQQQLDLALRTAATATHGPSKLADQSRYKPRSLNFALGEDPFAALYLIYQGANPGIRVSKSYNVLHYICSRESSDHEHRDLFTTFLSRHRGPPQWINEKDANGKTALYWAVQKRNRDFVHALLKFGADANMVSNSGQSPLHAMCIEDGDRRPHKVTLSAPESVLQPASGQHGLGGGPSSHRDSNAAQFPRHFSLRSIKDSLMDEEILQALLANGADTTLANQAGQTPFLLACETGNAFVAANILYHQARTGAAILQGGLTKTLRELFFFPAENNLLGQQQTALHLAARAGHLDVVKLLLNPRHVFVRTVNPWRLRAKTTSAVLLLPSDDPATNSDSQLDQELRRLQKPGGLAPLTSFSEVPTDDDTTFTLGTEQRGWLDSLELPNVSFSSWTVEDSDPDLAEWYRATDESGKTALHLAAAGGHVEVVRCLLGAGVIDPYARDGDDKTAAELALGAAGGAEDIWHVLAHHHRVPDNSGGGSGSSIVDMAAGLLLRGPGRVLGGIFAAAASAADQRGRGLRESDGGVGTRSRAAW
ncbi:ankyrin repeat-containing domain protein [Echria macrotheca]|uniref:Ankyrin repeat-containing domain protein n=1 Tax=Echria macrotheca TaxID=438768 RepID=A0AAJ0BJ22_9PEZI|nr:ankyrin repeat-containing domain protein [Echria macrotheca]